MIWGFTYAISTTAMARPLANKAGKLATFAKPTVPPALVPVTPPAVKSNNHWIQVK